MPLQSKGTLVRLVLIFFLWFNPWFCCSYRAHVPLEGKHVLPTYICVVTAQENGIAKQNKTDPHKYLLNNKYLTRLLYTWYLCSSSICLHRECWNIECVSHFKCEDWMTKNMPFSYTGYFWYYWIITQCVTIAIHSQLEIAWRVMLPFPQNKSGYGLMTYHTILCRRVGKLSR